MQDGPKGFEARWADPEHERRVREIHGQFNDQTASTVHPKRQEVFASTGNRRERRTLKAQRRREGRRVAC